MNIPCPNFSPCPEVYPPYTNLSSEDPDRYVCIGRSWGNYQSPPRLGSSWTEKDCYRTCEFSLSDTDLIQCRALGADMCSGECVETVSQSLADICANNASTDECNPVPPPNNRCYPNTPQSYTAACPDGSGFTYTTPAGTFCESSQAIANTMAASYAVTQANALKHCLTNDIRRYICLSDLGAPCTTDDSITLTITASGNGVGAINTWALEAGSLPDGLSLDIYNRSSSTTISGTPTTAGVYSFVIRMTGPSGAYAERSYTVEVLEKIDFGAACNVTLTQPSCVHGMTDKTMNGTMPDGLNWSENLSGNDIMSGTPTTSGTCAFTISYTATTNPPPAIITSYALAGGTASFMCSNLIVGTSYQITVLASIIGGITNDVTFASFVATAVSMPVGYYVGSTYFSISNPRISTI